MSLSRRRKKNRSAGAQIARMQGRWPSFDVVEVHEDRVSWSGVLTPLQRPYRVGVVWTPTSRPYVWLINPALRPREGGGYEDIPHLMFHEPKPELSGLCLFDPESAEWTHAMLVADTTIPWAARWLYYYEFWHYDGIWRGGGVGFENITQARAADVHGAASADAKN